MPNLAFIVPACGERRAPLRSHFHSGHSLLLWPRSGSVFQSGLPCELARQLQLRYFRLQYSIPGKHCQIAIPLLARRTKKKFPTGTSMPPTTRNRSSRDGILVTCENGQHFRNNSRAISLVVSLSGETAIQSTRSTRLRSHMCLRGSPGSLRACYRHGSLPRCKPGSQEERRTDLCRLLPAEIPGNTGGRFGHPTCTGRSSRFHRYTSEARTLRQN